MSKPMARAQRALGRMLLALACVGPAASASPCNPEELAYVGTDGAGIRALRFDACAGSLSALGQVAEARKTRWLLKHPQRPLLYVAAEGERPELGRLLAYEVESGRGALTLRAEADSGGAGPTHLWLDRAATSLLVSHFGSGSVASLALGADGLPGALLGSVKAYGSGPHRRQASPHAHGAEVDPGGRFVLVADMGADRVFVHGFERGALRADAAPAWQAAPGSGPRRAVFGAGVVYVLNELSAEIVVLGWEAGVGRLAPLPRQTLALSGPGFQGAKSASELALSRDGRFLYVANRGEHELQVFRVDPADGTLVLLQRLPSGGEAPWAFEIHPSGRWLLVANQRSGRLNLFAVDPASGRLENTGRTLDAPTPVSLAFVN